MGVIQRKRATTAEKASLSPEAGGAPPSRPPGSASFHRKVAKMDLVRQPLSWDGEPAYPPSFLPISSPSPPETILPHSSRSKHFFSAFTSLMFIFHRQINITAP